MKLRSRVLVLFASLAVLVSLAGSLTAAETLAAEPVPAEEPPPPEAIAIPEVIDRATAEQRKLQEVEARAAETEEIQAVIDGLSGVAIQLQDDSEVLRALVEQLTRLQEIEDAEKTWQRGRRTLEIQHATVTGRARKIEEMMASLAATEVVWKATNESAREGDAPPAVLEHIRATLRQVDDTRKSVSTRRDRVLGLQAEIAGLLATHDETRDYLSQKKVTMRTRLLRTEGVPLWTDLFRSDKVFSRERAVDHIRRDAERLRAFWGDHRGAMALHALFVVFVSGLFLYLRAHESRGAEDETTEAVRIFQRPYAAAFLLAAVPAHYLLYAAAPSVARGVIGITSLVAILRTTPILLPASAHAAIYAVATLFFIDRFRDLIAGMPLLERLVFTSEMIFAIVALGLFQRPALLSHFSPSPRWSAMLGFAVRLGIVLLGAAIVASVIGSEIGRVVAVGVFSASYVAMLLSVAYEVMTDVVGLAARSQRLRRLHMFEHHSELLRRRTLSLLRFVAILIWFQVTLDRFGIGESLYGAVGGLLSARLNVGMLSLSLGGVLSLAATLAVAVYTSRFVRFILNEDVLPRLRLGRGVSNAVSATVHQIILIVGFLAALAAGGVDLTQFGILAGALGVGIGFGLQNVVNNFVSGIILLFERPIQPGDTIEVGTLIGEVRRIGMRASIVRTFEGAEVIVPNASLISDQVVNWTLSDQVRRIDVNVSVAYGTDPEKVIALLREVAQNDERLMREPGPAVLFLKFGDSALEFQLRSWTADFAHWIVIRSELHVAVNRALRDAGITIPFPQTDLHLKSLPEGAGTHAD